MAAAQREERIEIHTQTMRITGTVTLPAEGYRSRITDYLNAGERDFIALTDVEAMPLADPDGARRHPFMAVARRAITYVVVADA